MNFRTSWLVALAAAWCALPLGAQENPLDRTHFMAGCWRGAAGPDAVIEEYYTTPSDNLVQGMTRYVRGGVTVDYEFTLIEAIDGRTRLRPHPKGQAAVAFDEREHATDRVVWENPEHDFPQRILYRAVTPDSLVARIEGTTASGERAMEWGMARIPCPGAADPPGSGPAGM